MGKNIIVIVRGYPRTDEIFIAQELVYLERQGYKLELYSLVNPGPVKEQAVHRELKTKVCYVPSSMSELKEFSNKFKLRNPLKYFSLWLTYRNLLVDEKSEKRFYQSIWIYQKTKMRDALVYAHFANAPTEVAIGVANLLNNDLFVFAHAKDIFTTPRWLLKERLKHAKSVFTCNKRNFLFLKELHPRVQLVYHGLVTRFFHKNTEFNKSLNFYSAGRLVEKKGYSFLLNVLRRLKDKKVDFRYTIYGDGEQREDLEKLVKRLGLENHVTFYGEYSLAEYSEKIKPGDIFLGGFKEDTKDGDRDGLPNTLLEAMYFGAIVVTTTSPAIDEVIEDSVNGFIAKYDEEDFLKKIISLKSKDLEKISKTAEKTIEDRFLFEKCAEKLIGHFKK